MEITPDSIFYFIDSLERITGKSKVVSISDNEIIRDDIYFLDDGTKIVFKTWVSCEIRKDVLIQHRLNVFDSGWYGYYRAYPR